MLVLLLVTPLIAAAPGDTDPLALTYPAPTPKTPLTCVYEGMVPGSTEQGRWTETVTPDGKRTIEFENADQWKGIAKARLAGHEFTVLSHSHQGLDQQRGPQRVTHDTFRFGVTVDEAPEPTELTVSVRVDSTCQGFPRVVKVGDVWTCDEQITDTWSTKGGPMGTDSGTTRLKSSTTIAFREMNTLEVPGVGPVQAAILEFKDADGNHQRVWVDPLHPSCPLKTDRIKVKHVVGTDQLVERKVAVPIAPAAQLPTGTVRLGGWALGMLIGLGCVILLAMGIGWIAGRRGR